MASTIPGGERRSVRWPPDRHWRGGGKPGRVSIKRSRELRDMLLVRDDPDRADLTPIQLEMRQLLVERPGAFVARLSALEEQHRAAVRAAKEQRRDSWITAGGSIGEPRRADRDRAIGSAPATAASPPQPPGVRPPADLVARRADRVVRLVVRGRFLVECLTNMKMRVEGLRPFEVVDCRYDPARDGAVILARSPDFTMVAAGGRIPEYVVEQGKRGRLRCR